VWVLVPVPFSGFSCQQGIRHRKARCLTKPELFLEKPVPFSGFSCQHGV
jgi:hypothetical protein